MSLYFTHPNWLWCAIPIVGILAFACKRSLVEFSPTRRRAILSIRAFVCAAILLALAGLTLAVASRRAETILLVDASASVGSNALQRAEAFAAQNAPIGKPSKQRSIYFAAEPNADLDALTVEQKNATNLESALFAALAAADPTCATQIVLFSDGRQTSGNAETAIQDSKIPISVVPVDASERPEVQAARLEAPERARQGATVKCVAVVQSSIETSGALSFYKNGTLQETRDVELTVGENRFEWDVSSGASDKELELAATIDAKNDEYVDNNRATAFVATDAAPQILVVAKSSDLTRNFTTALKAQDLQTQSRPIEGFPTDPLELERFDAIVLSDAPATSFTLSQLNALRDYVRDFGGGVLAIGGENSFGAGGYARTPLDDLLPVRSTFEKEKEKPSLAIALVIDRSGSMDGDKIELTKDAAKGVVELLAPQDYIEVIAFDDAPREIAPLQNALSPSAINESIGAIAAEGSTNIYPALAKATDDLLRANAKFKHVILLTDGQSVPGDYEKALRKAANGNITVSTVGIGGDADKFLLEKLASEGSGRFYYCEDASSVPQIFARETKLADRSNFNETPFLALEEPAASTMLDGISMEYAPPLLGNIVVRAKPTSETALSTETGDPLLTYWRYGLGKAAAFTSDVDGRWSAEWLDWAEFPQFWAQTVRFVARSVNSERAEVQIAIDESRARLTLDARDRNEDYLNDADTTVSVVDGQGRKRELEATQKAPGLYEAAFPVKLGEKYRAFANAAKGGKSIAAIDRVFFVDQGRESDVNPPDETLMRAIAERTGGLYDPTPQELSAALKGAQAQRGVPLRFLALALALIVYVVDVYLRRGVFAK